MEKITAHITSYSVYNDVFKPFLYELPDIITLGKVTYIIEQQYDDIDNMKGWCNKMYKGDYDLHFYATYNEPDMVFDVSVDALFDNKSEAAHFKLTWCVKT